MCASIIILCFPDLFGHSGIILAQMRVLVNAFSEIIWYLFERIFMSRPILNEKIKTAKALLATTEMSVKSISEKLCFADEHYFSHLFKQKTGLSPLKYKATKKELKIT